MKFLEKIKKKEQVDLLKCKEVKAYIKEHQEPFHFYKLDASIKKVEDFFYFESLIQTILNKETIENGFIKIFDDMVDYWQTLTYEERKKLVNIELHQKLVDLPYVPRENQRNFLPHLDEKMNRIYEDEMVLFELKQYNALRFDFKHLIQQTHVTLEMIQHHFTSLIYVEGDEEDYMAYCPRNHTLYHFVHHKCVDAFTFALFQDQWDELKKWIALYRNQNENECCWILFNMHWVSEKSCRRIEKYLRKQGVIL